MIQQFIRVAVGWPQCGESFQIVDRGNALCFRKLGQRQGRPERTSAVRMRGLPSGRARFGLLSKYFSISECV